MRIAPSTPLAVLLAVLAVVPGGGVPAQSTVVVANLRCEYRTSPIGIDEARPRLGWVLTAGRRDEGQTAYQVVVATSEALLAHQQGDLWDSGKVASANSVHIVYDGKPLRSRASCYWKVRVWDREGRA